MNFLHNLVCVHTSNLLRSVPIPETFGGILHLSFKDVIGLTVFGAVTAALSYSVYTTAMLHSGRKKPQINHEIKKHLNKCVDIVDVESITDKKAYCRCWQSAKFPYCDGSHNKHNEETGDNIGPLIIEPKKTA
ncbi:Zinc finger CDGSH domain-containing protein 1 [Paragonimus heterotremus]|uniref:CDGSH iron-sulfur domain-containing protein 2 homologue n=1 Tax=Paragonimus heterotremus TaxID=100268 RepID=A0A8J4WLV8_9TREM|nr:Zinc finger CDGSH domain-containing protein 1 [Paragonimus heterotremus]